MKEASKGVREKKKKSSRCDRQMKPPENTNSSVEIRQLFTFLIFYIQEKGKIKEREIWNKWSSNEKTIVLPLFYSITYGNNKKPSDPRSYMLLHYFLF